MEGQDVSSGASLAREGLLGAALPTAEHVTLRQPSLTNAATPQSVGRTASQSNFSAVNVEAAAALNCLSSYNEIVGKLHRLWDDQLTVIQNVDDNHWKNPAFPLARIKKIMRMDEDVKMISSEVPLMLSKAVEIFVTELSLRAWLHTEESKRRTVQRSDIAMAITKQDMFDFLIDIVPREEIQLKAKPQPKQHSENDQLQLLTPELLQLCAQHLMQQQQPPTTTVTAQQPPALTQAQQQLQAVQTQQQQQQQQRQQVITPQQQQQQQVITSQQQQQQIAVQQQQQQQAIAAQLQQQLSGEAEGDIDEASARILQDNLTLIQQLQQLLQLQLQVQHLQENFLPTSTASGDNTESLIHNLQLPHTSDDIHHTHTSIASSVLTQPDQILSTPATTDSIHRVTINAANDMLSEAELGTSITSASASGSNQTPRPTTHTSPLNLPLSSSASKRQSVSMAIEPELHVVEQGQSSPSSHEITEDAVRDTVTLLAQGSVRSLESHSETQKGPPPLVKHSSGASAGQTMASLTQETTSDPSSLVMSLQMRQFRQLEPQISNILIPTADGAGPEQYVIQTAPLLELVSSSHTVSMTPSSVAEQQGVELCPITESSRLTSTVTPVVPSLVQPTSRGDMTPYSTGVDDSVSSSSMDTSS